MSEPVVAFAVSSRGWSDSFHRFLADHGGARMRVSVLHPDDIFSETFDVLIIDDICSFLTPRLVIDVHELGRRLVGVYDPAYPEGKNRLTECGIEIMVDSESDPEIFLQTVTQAAQGVERSAEPTATERTDTSPPDDPELDRSGILLGVGGPAGGPGVTEVAVALAAHFRQSGHTYLVDADQNSPILGPRLGVSPLPNLRSLVDRVEHHSHPDLTVDENAGLTIIPGGTGAAGIDGSHPMRLIKVLETLRQQSQAVVVDLGTHGAGSGFRLGSVILEQADWVLAVANCHPTGVVRLLEWLAQLHQIRPQSPALIVFNRANESGHRRLQLVNELQRTYPIAGAVFLPADPLVTEANWKGTPVDRGPFTKAISRLVARCSAREEVAA